MFSSSRLFPVCQASFLSLKIILLSVQRSRTLCFLFFREQHEWRKIFPSNRSRINRIEKAVFVTRDRDERISQCCRQRGIIQLWTQLVILLWFVIHPVMFLSFCLSVLLDNNSDFIVLESRLVFKLSLEKVSAQSLTATLWLNFVWISSRAPFQVQSELICQNTETRKSFLKVFYVDHSLSSQLTVIKRFKLKIN